MAIHPQRLQVPAAACLIALATTIGGAQPLARPAAEPTEASLLFETRCAGCHDDARGVSGLAGPTLVAVIGRPIASVPDYRFSDALRRLTGRPWTRASLDEFLRDPQKFAPGTRMEGSVPDARDRSLLIGHLGGLSRDASAR